MRQESIDFVHEMKMLTAASVCNGFFVGTLIQSGLDMKIAYWQGC